jgi:hypothetical protein
LVQKAYFNDTQKVAAASLKRLHEGGRPVQKQCGDVYAKVTEASAVILPEKRVRLGIPFDFIGADGFRATLDDFLFEGEPRGDDRHTPQEVLRRLGLRIEDHPRPGKLT